MARASDVVRQGLRLLQEQEMTRQAQLNHLQSQIDLGLDQARRGELLDGEAVFKELEQRVSERDRARRPA
jgi:antitoxin ParD1/3/4